MTVTQLLESDGSASVLELSHRLSHHLFGMLSSGSSSETKKGLPLPHCKPRKNPMGREQNGINAITVQTRRSAPVPHTCTNELAGRCMGGTMTAQTRQDAIEPKGNRRRPGCLPLSVARPGPACEQQGTATRLREPPTRRRKKKMRNEPKNRPWRTRQHGSPPTTNPNRTHFETRFNPNEPTRKEVPSGKIGLSSSLRLMADS